MLGMLTVAWNRVLQVLGRLSMYRLVLYALALLALIAFGVSFTGQLLTGPLEIVATSIVLTVACMVVDAVAHAIVKRPLRYESSLITAFILLFIVTPSLEPGTLAVAALAAAVASASKFVLAWRGRHIFNPAAFGAAVVAISGLGYSSWWVGVPILAIPVAVLGIVVLWRTEKLRVILVFLLLAVATMILRMSIIAQEQGLTPDGGELLMLSLGFTPFLFLGAFMLSEPLTLPPRRWQQFSVAALVGILAGWPIQIGWFTLGEERALLIGNLLAFAFAVRAAVRLTLVSRDHVTPTVQQLTFRAGRGLSFVPGQYLELDVPHRRPDARGTRREFSIASAPEDLPEVRIAFRDAGAKHPSSYKKALAAVEPGGVLAVTGVWGDFVLPRNPAAPLLLVAAGIGVTPFVSQLRHAMMTGEQRDIVLVYVASGADELAFRADIEASGIPVVVFTRDRPTDLPAHWQWATGVRLDAAGLAQVVPDLVSRHAYVSGPPGLIADLAPALERARSLTTDAFSGY